MRYAGEVFEQLFGVELCKSLLKALSSKQRSFPSLHNKKIAFLCK